MYVHQQHQPSLFEKRETKRAKHKEEGVVDFRGNVKPALPVFRHTILAVPTLCSPILDGFILGKRRECFPPI